MLLAFYIFDIQKILFLGRWKRGEKEEGRRFIFGYHMII